MGYPDVVVDPAAERGLQVIIEPHNGGRYYDVLSGTEYVLGSLQLPYSAFADLWKKLAMYFNGHPGIYGYDLMNEPNRMDVGSMDGSENWKRAAQAAIDAIRAVDTRTPIIVAGYHWRNACLWPSQSDGLKYLLDPSDKLIFEAHQYLDADYSGSYDPGEPAAIVSGPELIKPFTDWLRANGKKGIIGELGTPPDQSWLDALDITAQFITENKDVLVGFQWWAAGPWWGDYYLSMEPSRSDSGQYVDKPQMSVLLKYQ